MGTTEGQILMERAQNRTSPVPMSYSGVFTH